MAKSFGGYWSLWWWCGLALGLALLSAAALAPRFAPGARLPPPILVLTGFMIVAGGFYLGAMRGLPQGRLSAGALAWLLLLGLGLRLAMFAGPAMLEDDANRFLWDGAVVGRGLNPYRYAPLQAHQDPAAPPALKDLARQAPAIVQRINYPYLKSIYPPLCQAAFALAHWLSPWSLLAWRLVLLVADAASLLLLWRLLRALRLPLAGLTVYWWNPLLIKEVYNSGHPEVLIFPFLLGALLLALTGRRVWAAGALGLAVGVKLWPGLLLP
ncbi:MAG: glycosyltransferase 87 family protein, partial [Thermodesulfobacteriota bacterium]